VDDEGDSEEGEHFLCDGHCGDWIWILLRESRGVNVEVVVALNDLYDHFLY
jgi:hypothetical protein